MGPSSPAVLITTSEKLARETMQARWSACSPSFRPPTIAGVAWRDYRRGASLCEDEAEMVREADRVASEHVQVMTRNPDYFLANMTNYGALFLGAAHQCLPMATR